MSLQGGSYNCSSESECWKNSSVETILPKPFDCTCSRSQAARSGAIASIVVVIVPAGLSGTALVKKNRRVMGRDFKALLTGLAGYFIIDSYPVISQFGVTSC